MKYLPRYKDHVMIFRNNEVIYVGRRTNYEDNIKMDLKYIVCDCVD
jgi:hypothetical protein